MEIKIRCFLANSIKMTRYIAMIPARLGSKRVPKKNLRLLGDKPLVAHVLETAVASEIFDEVYLNSEADIFSDIARDYGAKFYKRPAVFSSDMATNDQFALDFIENVSCDVLVQINPTSPFLNKADIQCAKDMFEKNHCDTVLAVEEKRIEGVFREKAINYNTLEPMPPSQHLTPIYVFCNGILSWRTDVFRKNIKNYSCAVYGGDGKTDYLVLKGDSVIDIDSDDDFSFAELVLEHRLKNMRPVPRYWNKSRSI